MESKVKSESRHWGWPSLRDHALFWPLALGGLGLDLWTKYLAFKHIDVHEPVDLIPGLLRFHLALNDGAAFSMAAGNRVFLVSISAVALVVLLGVFLLGGNRPRLMTIALGLFTGGVAGNFYDRAFYFDPILNKGGLVRDFIDMYIGDRHWPTYNVADSLLCIAVGLLLIQSFLAGRTEASEKDSV